MRALRAVVQAFIAAIVLLEFVGAAVIAPAEARFVFATEDVVINNVAEKPQITITGLNTTGGINIERPFDNFLIRNVICGSWRPTESLVHSVSRMSFDGRWINFPSADYDLSQQ